MADIIDINEFWHGHSGLEVETFLKRQLALALSASEGKFGAVARIGTDLVFYDEENGNVLGTVSLSGENYAIDPHCNLPQTFYILADEPTKIMTIAPTTTVSQFGSQTAENYPEAYSYVVAVNTGSGYVNRLSGDIGTGGSASFDIRPYLATGDNYIRVTITGMSSNQSRSVVYTGTLTTLTMSCAHAWQNIWNQGQDYNITGIRFAGSLVKTLHVSVNNVELEPREYAANQSYTTTATFYTIPASAFPSNGNSVCSVKLWMTAQGVSTKVISYNIMCVAENDTTPLVAINDIAPSAVNYTSGVLFSYAVYNANKVSIDLSATLNSVVYNITTGYPVLGREAGVQYPFAFALEVDTGANETKIGSLAISATAYLNDTVGGVSTASSLFDNSFSYVATPGALFYINAATRDNGAANHEAIVNEATPDSHFASSYAAEWSGMSWYNDGWSADSGNRRALYIPAGCTCAVTGFKPLDLLSFYDGMSIEFLLQNANPSDYSVPVLTIASGGSTPLGIEIYPTKIIVWGSAERAEDFQTVNISENRITHICVTFVKGYEGVSGKNLCSVYINGISNICFSFDGSSSFGNGNMVIGQPDTDFYLYKMRVYGSALEAQAVFNNFLNCVFDGVEFTRTQLNAENNVLDGDIVDYTKVKAAGYNIMVVTTPNNVAIPSFFNNVTVKGCAVRFEYAGEEEKNVTVDGVDMDGQGTTSKKYFRWNLRWKTSDETVWTYGDGTSETGKEGHFIKDESHARVDRITAKKNIASSPQGHKMGLTGLYNDLFHAINAVADGLPDQTFRVAVFQFPFVGFKYNTENGQYDFIGIYTVGPDKGSKVTFGYKKKVYPNCLSIEGPNHAPRGTRFLTPWADVEYSPADETLNMNEDEAWDCDYVKYETTYGKNGESYPDDWAAIRALYESEWRPAYECVYNNSPYIASYQEVIAGLNDPSIDTLEKLLTIANASAVKGAKAVGMTLANEYITFYDSSYELYFYRRAAGRFVSVAAYNTETGDNLVHNALTGLSAYLTEAADPTHPTTAEIIAARGARFHATAGDYFDIDQTLFHYCFCIIWAVTDNFAKNSYPQKFLLLSESGAGNRWGWRQDDLDSVLMTDNNGTNTKKYSVEHLDTFDNTQIFQGGDSALWVLIKEWFQTETRDMMSLIASAASTLANRLGIQGSGEHESLFNLTSYYCWDHSAKYFPATLYEKERRWSYIEPWLLAGTVQPGSSDLYPSAYNGVAPLTQAVGDQYQGERLWMERRIAYIFSKYRLGAFSGTATGYNAIVFTLARTFTFTLTPAIDLYPVVSLVESDSQAGRTPAGTPAQVSIATTGDSNNSIHGGDWLADLGDLSQMRLGSRGGATSIDFFIVAARLQTLKIGDADASRLVDGFNATGFGVTSPTLTYLDARNTGTVRNNINLLGCPRLRTCLFEGSGAAGLLLPVGAKLTVVSFPSAANTVFMHSLQFLRYEDTILPALAGITTLYINNCANLNPLEIVEDIIETVGEQLAYATLIWGGLVQGSVNTLIALSERSGWVEFDGESVLRRGGKPHVEGMVQISGMFVDDLDGLDIVSEETYQGNLKKALSDLFGTKLYVIYDPDSLWIRFADENVKSVCVTNWDTNGDGELSTLEASVVTYSQMSGKLNLNTIVSFDEFVYFTGVTRTGNSYVNFGSAVNLEYITIPSSVTNVGDRTFNAQNGTEKSLKRITFNNTRGAISFGSYVVYDTTAFPNLAAIVIKSLDNWLNNSYSDNNYSNPLQRAHHLYVGEDEVTSITFPSTKTSVQGYCLYGMSYLTSINLHSAITSIGAYAFSGCSRWVDNLVIPNSVTSISQYAFNGCTGLLSLTTPSSISTLNIAALVGGAARYGRVIVQGNLTHNSATGTMSTNHVVIKGNFSNPYATQAFSTYCKSVRVAGDWANSSGFVIYAGSGATSQFEFLEVLGVISGSGRIFYNQANTSQVSGCIVHLGYNGIGSTPALIFKNSNGNLVTTRISKVYVGSGESEAADQAVLDQYLADSDWAAYSSKLDLWWNYKNSPNANPYYITPINQL